MKDPREIDYELDGISIKLQMAEGVFLPTLTTQLLAGSVTIQKGIEVLDLGCGIGPLGILAAKKGASSVTCVDVMPEACRLTSCNARTNGVSETVAVFDGHLFEPIPGKTFDVIINDVSAVAEDVARISPWFPQPVPTGGFDGTTTTLQMLNEVRGYLKPGGKLYFPLLSLCRSQKILTKAEEVFENNLEVLVDKMIPFCPELYEHLPLLMDLQRLKIIDFTSKKSRRLWNLRVLLGTKV